MNYLRIYKNLINLAKNRVIIETELYEKHHIISKCIFNDNYSKIIFNDYYKIILSKNSKKNIVKLTLREHYIAHLLLVRIFENDKNCYIKLLYAANFLTNRTKNNREYEWQKKEYIEQLKISMIGKPSRAKGKKWSDESKKNKSGENHYMYNKTYDDLYSSEKVKELKEIKRKSQTGRKKSDKEREKLSKRIITEEWKDKISKSNKGKKRTKEQINKLKKYFSDTYLNPSVDQTIYKFYHKDGRIEFLRKIDMKNKYKCSDIHKLIRGDRNTCKGWSYKGEIKKSDD